jgi:hypothetical protein
MSHKRTKSDNDLPSTPPTAAGEEEFELDDEPGDQKWRKRQRQMPKKKVKSSFSSPHPSTTPTKDKKKAPTTPAQQTVLASPAGTPVTPRTAIEWGIDATNAKRLQRYGAKFKLLMLIIELSEARAIEMGRPMTRAERGRRLIELLDDLVSL